MSAGQFIDVGSIAQLTLEVVVAHFAASSVALPERQFIAAGDPRELSWDNCESVFVACGGILWGAAPGTGSATAKQTGNQVSAMILRHTVIEVQIVREVPQFDPDQGWFPDAVSLTESALRVHRDAGLLSQALVEACVKGGPFQRYGAAIAGAVEPIGPRGGYCASAGNLTVTAGALITG